MNTEPTTSELLAAGIGGDQQAWNLLVDRMQGAIWGATSRLNLSPAHADDVFQTVWLRLLDRHETIRDPERLAGWLGQVARNEGLALIRRQARDQPSALIDLRPSPIEEPHVELTRRTDHELVLAGFAKLSEWCKDLLYLVAHRTPYSEISNRLGVAVGTIGPARKRCLHSLRAQREVQQAMEPLA